MRRLTLALAFLALVVSAAVGVAAPLARSGPDLGAAGQGAAALDIGLGAAEACAFDCGVVESCANDAGCLGPCVCEDGACIPAGDRARS